MPSRASRASSSGHRAAKPKGGRRAHRQRSHAAPTQKRSLKPSLSMPVAAGTAALVFAGIGAVVVDTGGDETPGESHPPLAAELGAAGIDTGARADGFEPSRDIDREVLEAQAEEQADQRRQALEELSARSAEHAKVLELNQWVLPLAGYELTATFGQPGEMWGSGYHTGLDFAAETGTPLVAVARGTITYTGSDPAYGNQTILTLDDGTEIWYCHQTTIDVSVGDEVDPGEHIGTVGSTGNTSGPHLHLEVHPDGAEEGIDPYTVLEEHGVTP